MIGITLLTRNITNNLVVVVVVVVVLDKDRTFIRIKTRRKGYVIVELQVFIAWIVGWELMDNHKGMVTLGLITLRGGIQMEELEVHLGMVRWVWGFKP
jgi:hypothetical protein